MIVKDFQWAVSTYNKTKHIENKTLMNWEITKIKSLQAILDNPNASKCLDGAPTLVYLVGALCQIPSPLASEESLTLPDS